MSWRGSIAPSQLPRKLSSEVPRLPRSKAERLEGSPSAVPLSRFVELEELQAVEQRKRRPVTLTQKDKAAPLPAWMLDRSLLPMRPPAKKGNGTCE